MTTEHRVKVGEYEFVHEHGSIHLERNGVRSTAACPWLAHGDAFQLLIEQLDAARVVVQGVRRHVAAHIDQCPTELFDALALHDRLTSDREPPSAWCGVEQAPQPDAIGHISDARLAEIAARASRDVDNVRLMSSVNARDLQLIVAELQRRRGRGGAPDSAGGDLDREIQMMETEGNLGERWQRGLAWLRELRERRNAERQSKEVAAAEQTKAECEIAESQATYRAFKSIDTAATIEDLNAIMAHLMGKLGHADHEDAYRRYEQRKAELEFMTRDVQPPSDTW